MGFSVIHADGLEWAVVNNDSGEVVAWGLSNAKAWREADRLSGKAIQSLKAPQNGPSKNRSQRIRTPHNDT